MDARGPSDSSSTASQLHYIVFYSLKSAKYKLFKAVIKFVFSTWVQVLRDAGAEHTKERNDKHTNAIHVRYTRNSIQAIYRYS